MIISEDQKCSSDIEITERIIVFINKTALDLLNPYSLETDETKCWNSINWKKPAPINPIRIISREPFSASGREGVASVVILWKSNFSTNPNVQNARSEVPTLYTKKTK